MPTMQKIIKNKWMRGVCFGLLLGVVCQLHIAPFTYSSYVVSLGTPVLSMLLLFQPTVPIVPLTLTMTVISCLLRGAIGMTSGEGFLRMFVPAALYYVPYSVFLCCFIFMRIRSGKAGLMMGIIGCDFIANTLQLVCMGHADSEAVLKAMAVAVIRGTLVWMLYRMYEWENFYLRKKEHQKHYAQLNQIVADIYAESFYLKKSMKDLNRLTRDSHQLYEDLEAEGRDGTRALNIARETHEIRKDYQRISEGIASLVREQKEKTLILEEGGKSNLQSGMKLSYILNIIGDNFKRQIEEQGKRVSFKTGFQTDLQIRRYYDIFTILNNLLINSADACQVDGNILLWGEVKQGTLYLEVTDDGCGMDEDTQKYIWGAGFSTKYDKDTGQMSTGIGLCHVLNIVEDLEGSIVIESEVSKGTKVSVLLPIEQLQQEKTE